LEFASTDDDHAPHHEPMSEWLEAKEVAVLHVYQIASPETIASVLSIISKQMAGCS
jgi:hypothetical protein